MILIISRAEILKVKLDSLRPLPAVVVDRLREVYVVDATHHSTALEGNTLTLQETRLVLEGITVGGKSLRELNEILDHKEALDYLAACVQREIPVTEGLIREIHSLVLRRTYQEWAGKYRKGQVWISGSKHQPPVAGDVPDLMHQLVADFNDKAQDLHPIHRAAWLHWQFVNIHPFPDGNGRTARLLLNLSLMRDGYPPVVITTDMRDRYIDALEKAHFDNLEPFIQLSGEVVVTSLERYIAAIG